MGATYRPIYAAVVPVEPPTSHWRFPDPSDAESTGLVGGGADLAPGTILLAYRSGLFPMPLEADGMVGWWSPDPRGVLELDDLQVSRSLRRSVERFEFKVNTAFEEVLDACAEPGRPHAWIDSQIRDAYVELHKLGWAHSVETWSNGELVGGLYGIAIGGLFAGESMFHRVDDASKAALVALVSALHDGEKRLIDVQWQTDHLASLGVTERSSRQYVSDLPQLLESPHSPVFTGGERTISPA